ncbi:MAG: phosphatidylserine/phosphatidylglycerophosphate/cardiolipin synthase family protein [Bdellovibrionales bacterium]|nr:phosphatidylserine/phosphatidylglycerophosphate/cardiolipin synthase family protein [Bdellovibrionales bacterium]
MSGIRPFATIAATLCVVIFSASAFALGTVRPEDDAFHESLAANILEPQQPAIAIDIEGLVELVGTSDAARDYIEQLLAQLPAGYQLFALDSSERAVAGRRPQAAIRRMAALLSRYRIRYLRNDFEFSPFNSHERRYSEVQLEKIKRIKFVESLPVVGVLGRPVLSAPLYANAGVKWIPFSRPIVGELPELERNHLAFINGLLNPDREQWLWDGLSASRGSSGNSIEFISSNPAAATALLDLVEKAETFIHVSNYALEDDPFGRRLEEALIRRARAGVKVRMIIDRVSMGPFGSDYGMVWLTRRMVRSLREGGVELRFHELMQDGAGAMPDRGPLTRRHRKWVIADRASGGTREIVAMGGSRVLASFSYEDTIPPVTTKLQRLLGIGWGPHWELSFLAHGPVVERIQRRFVEDFKSYGGIFTPQETADLLAPQSRQASNTTLRYVPHETYLDQNCIQVLLRLMEDPNSDKITFVNSFVPPESFLRAIESARARGKKIEWIMGGVHFEFKKRVKLVSRMFRAGVELRLIPVQLQVKLYGNDRVWAFGTHNLKNLSQRDTEDLIVMERGQEQGAALDAYVESLRRRSHFVNDYLKPGASSSDVEEFAEAALTPSPAPGPQGTAAQAQSTLAQSLSAAWSFLVTLPFHH